jgi:glycerol kinase
MSAEPAGLVLALDQGGQSSRACVFDARGDLLARASVPVAESHPAPERVEQDPEELVRSLRTAAESALAALGERAHEVVACGLATQRSSLACWDRASGAPLAPILSWQDRRGAAWLARFEPEAREIERRTGLRLSPHYGASKIAWCLRELGPPRAGFTCGPLASFLAFRLLEQRPLLADAANATRTLCFGLAEADWDPWLLELFGIPRSVLPECAPTRAEFGSFACAGLRIPLRVLTGDQSAALYAGGEPRADALYVNLGTGAFAQRTSAAALRVEGLLTSLVRREAGRSSFVLEGTVNGAGSALAALGLADPVAAFERGLRSAGELPLFLNGHSGLGAPFWRPEFHSRFLGEGGLDERCAAVAESVLFLLLEIERAMRPACPAPARIVGSGGLSQSDALCARLADLSGVPVERPQESEATARGLAFLVRGAEFAGEVPAPARFEPRADARLAARHARWRAALESALESDLRERR